MDLTKDSAPNEAPLASQGRRKLATIMFSDICGYTALMGHNELLAMQLVEKNLEMHKRLLSKYNGQLVKEMGDGLLMSFDTPSDAVSCAKELVLSVQDDPDLNLHIGIHQGEVVFTDNDVFGEGVNISSRIDSEALPGEILVSEEVWKNIRNKGEFDAISIGKKQLKNVKGAVKIYRIILDNEKTGGRYLQNIKRRKGEVVKHGVLILLPILLIAALYIWYDRWYGAPLTEYKTIAVLPFEGRNIDPELAYLGEGIAEEVIGQFFGLPTISVISSRSSFQFQNTNKSIRQLSRALQADLILEGSFVMVDETLEVKVELVSAASNEILNYASFASDVRQVKSLAADISREVFRTLRLTNWSQTQEVEQNRELNVEAYKYYTMGKNAMRDNTQQSRDQVIQYFTTAIELDSTYADAYIGMAEAYIFDVNRGYLSPTEALTHARKYIMEAESLMPGSGEVQGLLGTLYYFEHNFRQAISHFERSLQISPNYDFTYHWYAAALAMEGQLVKDIEMLDRAIILDPLNALYHVLKAIHLTFQNDYDGAQHLIEDYLEVNPEHSQMLWTFGVWHMHKKDYQAAYDLFLDRNIGLKSNFVIGYAYAMLGMEAEALIVLNTILKKLRTQYVPPTQQAFLYVGLGEYDKALDKVEEAYLVHDAWIVWLKYSNLVDPIRDNPRFVHIMEQLGD